MRLTANFFLQEFVPESVFKKFGNNATWFLCREHVESMQWLRDELTLDFGKEIRLVVNNWHTGGPHNFRGLRTETALHFNPWSQHSYKCNASDFDSPDASDQKIYDWMIASEKKIVANTSIRAIEDIKFTKTWNHGDSRWIPNAKGLLVVKP